MSKGGAFHQPMMLTVLLAVSHLLSNQQALADSPRSWGYWDTSPQAASLQPLSNSNKNQTGQQLKTTQNITGMERGEVNTPNSDMDMPQRQSFRQSKQMRAVSIEGMVKPIVLVPELPPTQYVAYLECVSECSGETLTINKMGVDLVAVNDINTNQIIGSTSLRQITTFDVSLNSIGVYEGIPFYLNDDEATIRHDETYFFDGRYREQVLASATSGDYSLSARAGSFSDVTGIASINIVNGAGRAVWGKRMVASEILSQMRMGQSYRFSGTSKYASVEMTVNFQNASWNGQWITTSGAPHNGFAAGGNFTKGGTLTSNFVSGSGAAGVDGFVKGGVVDATLTKAIHGPSSNKMGVVGQSNIEVVSQGTTKRVIENFSARQVSP